MRSVRLPTLKKLPKRKQQKRKNKKLTKLPLLEIQNQPKKNLQRSKMNKVLLQTTLPAISKLLLQTNLKLITGLN